MNKKLLTDVSYASTIWNKMLPRIKDNIKYLKHGSSEYLTNKIILQAKEIVDKQQ